MCFETFCALFFKTFTCLFGCLLPFIAEGLATINLIFLLLDEAISLEPSLGYIKLTNNGSNNKLDVNCANYFSYIIKFQIFC